MSLKALLATGQIDAPAIAAPERDPMRYSELRDQCERLRQEFADHGISSGERVAMVFPNGPEMAVAFVAVASVAAAAPLNPSYKASEFEFYLEDLGARAVMLLSGFDSEVRSVAAARGIPVIEVMPVSDGPAGAFRLQFPEGFGQAPSSPPDDTETALVLHTSGTTSRPKIVPLGRSNLVASARHIATSLRLESGDVCLNVMPLFHIHGLIAAVLASLSAGASVNCTGGFNAMKFYGWLESIKPSWYTAVPTMHQAILERAARNESVAANTALRFIRSSSSSLPPQVMQEMEAVFRCPVIEAYGMTEAAHQMASNELPPGQRKAGAVGVAAGPEVRLMDSDGLFVPQGGEGEIVIRGPNVTSGYEANPQANESAFARDPEGGSAWFRTGDLGVFDADGFLRISGRLKEIINRGGEKIAPREVDDVLMDHEAIAQVVTFAVPHPKLGEDVGVAVVLRDGAMLDERDLRAFAADRLAAFKVPKTILFVDEIPKGSTGKLQRIGLAEKLGIGS